MSRRIVVRSAADADVDHYFLYLAMENETVAYRFLAAVDMTYEKIAAWPGMGRPRESRHPDIAGIRSIAIDGFPNHLVFYRVPDDESVRILRVRHGAMDLNAVPMPDEE